LRISRSGQSALAIRLSRIPLKKSESCRQNRKLWKRGSDLAGKLKDCTDFEHSIQQAKLEVPYKEVSKEVIAEKLPICCGD